MKIFKLLCIALFAISFSAAAQVKPTGKAIIKTPGLIAEACKDRVERILFKMYGVTFVKADVKKKTTTVTWITDRTDIEQIKTAIANAGFDADDVIAEESAVKSLPPACKAVVVAPVKAP